MAPEQCRGGRVTPASDVYGLGATLYESLTGRSPFPEGTRRKPFPQLALSPLPLRSFAPAVPVALEKLVLACLAPNPAARPSMAELLPKLHEFIRTGPRMCRRPSSGPAGVRGRSVEPQLTECDGPPEDVLAALTAPTTAVVRAPARREFSEGGSARKPRGSVPPSRPCGPPRRCTACP